MKCRCKSGFGSTFIKGGVEKKLKCFCLLGFNVQFLSKESYKLKKMSSAQNPSLCIPRVFANITKDRVSRVFYDLNLGEVDRIDMIPRTSEKGEKFQRVFVHFKYWASNQNAHAAKERVLSGGELKIVYDDPWFWKVSLNKSATTPNDARPRRAYMELDEPLTRRPEPRDDRRPPRDDRRPQPRDDRRPQPRDDRRPPVRRPLRDNRASNEKKNVRAAEEFLASSVASSVASFNPRSPSSSPPRQRPASVDEGEHVDYESAQAFKAEIEHQEMCEKVNSAMQSIAGEKPPVSKGAEKLKQMLKKKEKKNDLEEVE